jgi:L-fuconolactonase
MLSCFGAERVMWGSDWPVVNLAGGYVRWREASLALIADLPAASQDLILGGVAERIYLSSRGKPEC